MEGASLFGRRCPIKERMKNEGVDKAEAPLCLQDVRKSKSASSVKGCPKEDFMRFPKTKTKGKRGKRR